MEALQSSPRREEIGWEADPAGFEDPQELRSRYYFRIERQSHATLPRPSARWRSSARTAGDRLPHRLHQRSRRQRSRPSGLRVLACMRVLG